MFFRYRPRNSVQIRAFKTEEIVQKLEIWPYEAGMLMFSVRNSILASGVTDCGGHFDLIGSKKSVYDISPAVTIDHNCNYKSVSNTAVWLFYCTAPLLSKPLSSHHVYSFVVSDVQKKDHAENPEGVRCQKWSRT